MDRIGDHFLTRACVGCGVWVASDECRKQFDGLLRVLGRCMRRTLCCARLAHRKPCIRVGLLLLCFLLLGLGQVKALLASLTALSSHASWFLVRSLPRLQHLKRIFERSGCRQGSGLCDLRVCHDLPSRHLQGLLDLSLKQPRHMSLRHLCRRLFLHFAVHRRTQLARLQNLCRLSFGRLIR